MDASHRQYVTTSGKVANRVEATLLFSGHSIIYRKMKPKVTEVHGTNRRTVDGSGILADMFYEQGGSSVRYALTQKVT